MRLLASAGSSGNFVDLDVSALMWVGTVLFVVALIVVDLVRHREPHAPSMKEAAAESIVWVAISLTFAGFIAWHFGGGAAGEFLSGYTIEKALSVDNVFVWALLFSMMGIPVRFQHKVLFWGIFGAIVMRTVFVFAGASLIQRFSVVLFVFAGFLLFTGVKVIRHSSDEGGDAENVAVRLVRRFMPMSEQLDGQRFFTRLNGKRVATPLLAALVAVELTDVIFAVDSVPAILAVSREPFLVLTSNVFAIMGLRSLYFLLADAKEKLHYLSHALGYILVFVAIKMAASHWWHMPTGLSLSVIAGILAVAVAASLVRDRRGGVQVAEAELASSSSR